MTIEGAISVKAAINGRKREVTKIYINKTKKTKDFNYIRKIARLNNIPVMELEPEELLEYLKGKSHGGVGAEVSLRKNDEFTQGDIFTWTGSKIRSISAMP